jgi:hypothetical protein
MRQIVKSQWFALFDLLLVIIGGAVWMLKPEIGLWSTLIALTPWILRIVSGVFPFRRTSFDWLIAIFLLTSWVGYWAAYDKTIAWSKFGLILMAALLYYAISTQPKENLGWLSVIFFCVGVGTSIYFFLTHDFVAAPRKLEFVNSIGRWIMGVRPRVEWMLIPPNHIAGIVAITTPFIFYPVWKLSKTIDRVVFLFHLLVLLGLGMALLAILMATSRGVILAIACAAGVWILWRIIQLNGIKSRLGHDAVFPSIVLVFLFSAIAILYLGPANLGIVFPNGYYYGNGSRAELFARSLYLLADFPFTGGGLGAFPGLYSHYMLTIPFFNVVNSHNLFLDVGIEQGLLGGLSFLSLFLGSVWFVSRSMSQARSLDMQVFSWLVLFALVIAIIHGMVDDYLYNGHGTILSLFLAGLSMVVFQERQASLNRIYYWVIGFALLALTGLLILNYHKIRSIWYADLGAVKMANMELAGFPTNEWAGVEMALKLDEADASLHSSLQIDPVNRTANHRLGLISMLRTDFDSASVYLEAAYKQTPKHRGIIKSLGYCYVWSGKMDEAQALLVEIPEAKEELGVYAWWWGTQGRDDLTEKASIMSSQLESPLIQP